MTRLTDSVTLPCGVTLKNRLAKAAMTEGLAETDGTAGPRLWTLYRRWAEGEAGLLISGNTMVDERYRERPANLIVNGEQTEAAKKGLQALAEAGKSSGHAFIVQLSHAGRQTPVNVAREPVGPSAIKVKLPGGLYGEPRALSGEEIRDIIDRFAVSAREVCASGFDGVQIHSAHGYLLSEFLNPLVNQREDEWGGSLENRARLLIETIKAVRGAISSDKILSVKLNSSDFQKGGFSFEDCLNVVSMIDDLKMVDLLEISGGNYEQPRMVGLDGLEDRFEDDRPASTKAREAYFMAYAEEIIAKAKTPIMVTGGFRTEAAMEEALEAGVTMLGLGRPLCVDPLWPKKLMSPDYEALPRYEDDLRVGPGIFGPKSGISLLKALNGLSTMAFYYENLRRLSRGKDGKSRMNLIGCFIAHQRQEARDARALNRFRSRNPTAS